MNSFPNLSLSRGFSLGGSGGGRWGESSPKSISVSTSTSTNTKPPSASQPHPHNPAVLGQPRASPTSLDRIFLTWSGQFKNKADIPSIVDGDVIHRARSYARIRINIGFLLFAALSGAGFVYWGKQDAKRGVSMEKMNLEWHRQVNEEHKKSSGGGGGGA